MTLSNIKVCPICQGDIVDKDADNAFISPKTGRTISLYPCNSCKKDLELGYLIFEHSREKDELKFTGRVVMIMDVFAEELRDNHIIDELPKHRIILLEKEYYAPLFNRYPKINFRRSA